MIPTNPSWPDAILVLLIVLYSVYSASSSRRAREQMLSGALSRGRVYSEIISVQWLGVLLLAAIWLLAARSAGDLGMGALSATFSSGGIRAWVAISLYSGYLLYKIWQVGRSAEAREQIREKVGDLDYFLPRTRGQLWGFSAVGITAGICEELLYRGFLLWWFQAALGMNVVTAAVVSTVVFGLGHAYQGWQGALRAGMMGAVLMAVRLSVDSLWPAMVLHAAADILVGWLIYRARPEVDGEGSSPSPGSPASFEQANAARA